MIDIAAIANVLEAHQKICGVLEFTDNQHEEIRCTGCDARIGIMEEQRHLMIDTGEATIEIL